MKHSMSLVQVGHQGPFELLIVVLASFAQQQANPQQALPMSACVDDPGSSLNDKKN